MSGAGRSSRVRKKPPASGMFELSGPRPLLCSSAKFSGVSTANSAGSSVVKLSVHHAVVLEVAADRQVLAHGSPKSARSSSGPIPESISSTGDW